MSTSFGISTETMIGGTGPAPAIMPGGGGGSGGIGDGGSAGIFPFGWVDNGGTDG